MLSIHSQSKENSDSQKNNHAVKQLSANFQLSVRSHNSLCPKNTVIRPIQDMRAHAGDYLPHNKARVNDLEVINESSLNEIENFGTTEVMERESTSEPNFARDPVLEVIAEITHMIDQLPSGMDITHDASVHISSVASVASQSQIDSVDFSEKLIKAIALQEKNLKLISQEIKQLLHHYDSADHELLRPEVQLVAYAKRVSDIHLAVTAIQEDIRNIPEYKRQALYSGLLKNTNKILIALDLSAKKLSGIAIKTVSGTAIDILRAEVNAAESVTPKKVFLGLKKSCLKIKPSVYIK